MWLAPATEFDDEVAVVVDEDDDDVSDIEDENEDEADEGVMLVSEVLVSGGFTNGLNWIGLHNERMYSLHSLTNTAQ